MNYEVINTDNSQKIIQLTNEDGSITYIPTDPANSDYQAYLAYVANGNTLPSESSIPTTPQAGE
jgi:hypothetical protein